MTDSDFVIRLHRPLDWNWSKSLWIHACPIALVIIIIGMKIELETGSRQKAVVSHRFNLSRLYVGRLFWLKVCDPLLCRSWAFGSIRLSWLFACLRTFKDDQHVYFLLEAALGGSLVQARRMCCNTKRPLINWFVLPFSFPEVVKDHPEIMVQDTPRGCKVAAWVKMRLCTLRSNA